MRQLIEIGNKAPKVCLRATNGEMMDIKDHQGKWVVLYFYPRDNTPGCTREALDFSGALKDFHELNAVVMGVSPDSVESHQTFADKNNLDITLLSDPDRSVIESFKAWGLKTMFGKKSMGVKRSTFLIDPEGNVAHIWPDVKVKGHVNEVLERLRELQNES